jgi:hypothetical protein
MQRILINNNKHRNNESSEIIYNPNRKGTKKYTYLTEISAQKKNRNKEPRKGNTQQTE